jgi:ribosomal protein S18 acetylase RimI-like enzyme
VNVRDASAADVPVIVDFNLAMALATEDKALDRDVLERGVRAVFDAPSKGFYLVAELDGAVVGQLMLTYEWSDWRNAWWWWIQSVYVRPSARRRGVFRALYDEAVRRARAAGAHGLRLYVEQDNAAAQSVYETLGMTRAPYVMFELGSE